MFGFRLVIDRELSRRVLTVLDQVLPELPGLASSPVQTLLLVIPNGETVEFRDVHANAGDDMPQFREVTPEQLALRDRIIALLSAKPNFIVDWKWLLVGAVRTPMGGFVVGGFFDAEEIQLAATTIRRAMREFNFFLQYVLQNCKDGHGHDELAQFADLFGPGGAL